MKINLMDVKKQLSMHKQEVASFMLMLHLMNVEDSFQTTIGDIVKTSETGFEIDIREFHIDNIIRQWVGEDPIADMFKD